MSSINNIQSNLITAKIDKSAFVLSSNFLPTNNTTNSPMALGSTPFFHEKSYEAIQQIGSPPDCNIAVGPSDLIVIVNFRLAMYDKMNPGNLLNEFSFTDWYSGIILTDTLVYDSQVLYDEWNSRFIIIAVGKNDRTHQSQFLVSTSLTSSVLGGWYQYSFDASANGGIPTINWADRPNVGIDGSNFFITANMYDFPTTTFQTAKIRVYKLSDLYGGIITQYAEAWDLRNVDNSKSSIIQPANRHGSKGGMFLVNAGSSGNLTLWLYSDPFGANSLSKTNISVSPFSNPPDAQQPGTTTLIELFDSRILQAQYRGSGIWAVHHILNDFGNGQRSAIRLYEIKSDGTGLWNEITFGASDYYLFFPSFTTDMAGNLIVSFSITSRYGISTILYPSIGYTGRLFQDPPNTINGIISIAKLGESYYSDGNPSRWGDYSGTAIDSNDNTTVWMFNQYAKSGNTISTWIATTTFFTYVLFLQFINR